MAGKDVKFTISAIDKASKKIKEISDKTASSFKGIVKSIKSVNDASNVTMGSLRSLVKNIESSGKSAKKADSSFVEFGKKAGIAIGSVYAAWKTLSKSIDAIQLGSKLMVQAESFSNLSKNMGISSSSIISNLERIAQGTIKTSVIMEKAGTAMMLGIPADKLSGMMEIAMATMKITGQTAEQAFGDLSLAIGRGSKMILDNLGIMVNVEKANEDYARSLNKASSALTDQERKTAFLNATMAAGKKLVRDIGTTTDSESRNIDKFTTSLTNLYENVAKSASKHSASFFGQLAGAINQFNNSLYGTKEESKIAKLRGDIVHLTKELRKEEAKPRWFPGIKTAISDLEREIEDKKKLIKEIEKEIKKRQELENEKQKEKQRIASIDYGYGIGKYGEMGGPIEPPALVERDVDIALEDFFDDLDNAERYEEEHAERSVELLKERHKKMLDWRAVEKQGMKDYAAWTVQQEEERQQKLRDTETAWNVLKASEMKDTWLTQANDKVAAAERANDAIENMAQKEYEQQKALTDRIEQGFSNAFNSVIEGTESVSDAFLKLAAQLAQVQLTKAATSYIEGLFSSANGNVFQNGRPLPFASGGVVSTPTIFPMANGGLGSMAEGGKPEAIMPLERGADGKLGVNAGGSGNNFYVQINAIDSKSLVEIMRRNPAAIIGPMVEQISNGNQGLIGAMRGAM